MSTDNNQSLRTTLEKRLELVLSEATQGKPDWKQVERETGVPAEKWRNFNRGAIKASPDMIEAIAKAYPDYAFWIATGLTEPECGHVAPSTWHAEFPVWKGKSQQWATEERKFLLALIKDQEQNDPDSTKLQADVERARKSKKLPAYYNTFKWISEALHEDERPEMFLLELHPRLTQIRKDRYRAQIALQNQIFEHRANAKITDPFETILGPLYQGAAKFSKSFNLFKKLFG